MNKKEKRKEIDNLVTNYKTKYKIGFLQEEVEELLNKYPNINMDKYNDAMLGNTCPIIEGKIGYYPIDVYHALLCGLENRDLTIEEWD